MAPDVCRNHKDWASNITQWVSTLEVPRLTNQVPNQGLTWWKERKDLYTYTHTHKISKCLKQFSKGRHFCYSWFSAFGWRSLHLWIQPIENIWKSYVFRGNTWSLRFLVSIPRTMQYDSTLHSICIVQMILRAELKHMEEGWASQANTKPF